MTSPPIKSQSWLPHLRGFMAAVQQPFRLQGGGHVKLEKLIEALTPLSISGALRTSITGISYDSRLVRPGNLFVALGGAKHDGRSFVSEALKRGAAAIVCENPEGLAVPSSCALLSVKNARTAMAAAACAFYGHPSHRLSVAGITGTNGKTTTAFLLRAILEADNRPTGLIGTVQYVIGQRVIPATRTTPEAPDLQALLAEMLEIGCKAAVMEVSSHALAQQRVAGMTFDAAVFTNLTHDHLDFHKTEDSYFEAKSRLFYTPATNSPGYAIINRDDSWGELLLADKGFGRERISFGLNDEADVRAEDVSIRPGGNSLRIASPWGKVSVQLKLLGRFNVSNALAAFSAACAFGVAPEVAASALENASQAPGRLEAIPSQQGFQVFVDYAHTQDALQNVLNTLREITPRRLIVVFGCGGDRDKRKRPLMGATATLLADYVVLTSDNPRSEVPGSILEQIAAGIEAEKKHEIIEDRREAIRKALRMAGPGDVVLVAGKGHENYQQLANTVVPFDDRQVVRECLKEMG